MTRAARSRNDGLDDELTSGAEVMTVSDGIPDGIPAKILILLNSLLITMLSLENDLQLIQLEYGLN